MEDTNLTWNSHLDISEDQLWCSRIWLRCFVRLREDGGSWRWRRPVCQDKGGDGCMRWGPAGKCFVRLSLRHRALGRWGGWEDGGRWEGWEALGSCGMGRGFEMLRKREGVESVDAEDREREWKGCFWTVQRESLILNTNARMREKQREKHGEKLMWRFFGFFLEIKGDFCKDEILRKTLQLIFF